MYITYNLKPFKNIVEIIFDLKFWVLIYSLQLDKATVLGDAIEYIKQLEKQVKSLEEKTKKCREEPAVKRPRLVSSYDDSSSSDEISSVSIDRSLPDIDVRASDGNILMRIYCKKQNGIMKEIFNQVDKLNLSIISCSVMPFGYNTSHITIIANQVLIQN